MAGEKILVVDDEDIVVKSISRLLLKQGFEPVLCRSGQEAVEKVQKESIDLIVCDIRMPGLNGVETLKQIRSLVKKPIPTIVITGYAEDHLNHEIEALEVSDYLYKPFDLSEFLACIHKHLGGK
ncbi:MAG: response regulator [Candidatus Omnitrophica bacterium]|nr:response regulator [Candidatus Omnitrophota bacterium]